MTDKPKRAKRGPVHKYGEPTKTVAYRLPESVVANIPEPVGETLQRDAIERYGKQKKGGE